VKIGLQYFGIAGRGSSVASLLDYTALAEECGLDFVCFPERHFGGPGGVSPDPLLLAAIALAETRSIEVRTGSLLLPLHEVMYVAERIEILRARFGARFGVVLGSGWNRRDFAPNLRVYDSRQERFWAGADRLRALIDGNEVMVPDIGGIRIETLSEAGTGPSWCAVACSVSSDTAARAASLGMAIHTHMERIGVDALQKRIETYYSAFQGSNSRLAGRGVTVMLHAMAAEGAADIRSEAIDVIASYLEKTLELELISANSGGQLSAGAKTDPALVQQRKEQLARYGAQRIVSETGLIGTHAEIRGRIDGMAVAGATEIAALIDFDPDAIRVKNTIIRLGAIRSELRST
jgi:natural product biosynthesis luciferase-like monooxygenase protein